MIMLKEKKGNITNTVKEFDVVHYCRLRLVQDSTPYDYSPDFKGQEPQEEN